MKVFREVLEFSEYYLWLPGTIQHHSGYDFSLPSTKQQRTSYDLWLLGSIGVRYNAILVTI